MKRMIATALLLLLLFGIGLCEEEETSFLAFQAAPNITILSPTPGQSYDAGGKLRVQAVGKNVKRMELTFVYDGETVTVEGVPVIVTTCDVAGGQGSASGESDPRQTGTVDEQAFDVFTVDPASGSIWATRIGGGEIRSWVVE